MSCVHYKFQSGLTYDFEGLHISSRELKRPVVKRHRLKTDEEHAGDDAVIPNNTSVIVRRIPAAGRKSTKRRFAGHQAQPAGGSSHTQRVGSSSHLSLEQLLKTENLNEAKASEEDKLKAVMYQSSLCYYSSSDAMQLLGLLPPNYVCFRCGIPGHHIKNCPSNRDGGSAPHKHIWRSAGIPHSFLMEVEDPGRQGVMLDGSGRNGVPIIAVEAYGVVKKEMPPFTVQTEPSSSSSSVDPVSSGQATRGKRPRSRSPAEPRSEQKRSRH